MVNELEHDWSAQHPRKRWWGGTRPPDPGERHRRTSKTLTPTLQTSR